jgi:hypothetical protein
MALIRLFIIALFDGAGRSVCQNFVKADKGRYEYSSDGCDPLENVQGSCKIKRRKDCGKPGVPRKGLAAKYTLSAMILVGQ